MVQGDIRGFDMEVGVSVKFVCEELCRLGDSVGFRCYFRGGVVYCLRSEWNVMGGKFGDGYRLLMASELVLEVVDGVVVCRKCRWGVGSGIGVCRDVVGELCDPGVFDSILRWFQVMAHRRDYGFG
jgi:hypothetical protein